jgi:putative DNA-invertase from lambdoid prophage Rac
MSFKTNNGAPHARGKRLGVSRGNGPKSDHFAPKVLALAADGCSYRLIAELGLSKNTVLEIVKRSRAMRLDGPN